MCVLAHTCVKACLTMTGCDPCSETASPAPAGSAHHRRCVRGMCLGCIEASLPHGPAFRHFSRRNATQAIERLHATLMQLSSMDG